MEKLTPNTTITLNNGVKMPIFGYSLENIGKKSYNIKTQTELLLDAIRIGYRFFDTCEDHGGLYALARAIRKSSIARSEFWAMEGIIRPSTRRSRSWRRTTWICTLSTGLYSQTECGQNWILISAHM